MRSCYNQRSHAPHYCRLTFALFGMATPSDWIADRQRTPFNLGRAIPLTGLTLAESAPLQPGLEPWNLKGAIALTGVKCGVLCRPSDNNDGCSTRSRRVGVAGIDYRTGDALTDVLAPHEDQVLETLINLLAPWAFSCFTPMLGAHTCGSWNQNNTRSAKPIPQKLSASI